MAQWAGAFGEGVALCERATEEPLHHRVGCAGDDGGVGQRLRIPGEQIRGRILRAAGRDGGGEMAVGIVGGSGEFIRRSCEQGDEVAAGGGTPRPDARRIEAVVAGMRAEPADGALTILDLGGENRVLAQPVVYRGDGVAAVDVGARQTAVAFVAEIPAAGM